MPTIDQLVETDNELEVNEDIRDKDKMLGKKAIQRSAFSPPRIQKQCPCRLDYAQPILMLYLAFQKKFEGKETNPTPKTKTLKP